MAIDVVLGDTVSVDNSGLLSGDQATIVGSGAIWKDDSDSTYADIVTQMNGPGQPQFGSSASCSIAAGDLAGLPSTTPLIARIRVGSVAAGMPYPSITLTRINASAGGSITGICPMTPTWVEIPVTTGDLAAFFADPASFTFHVVSPFKSGASGGQHWRIYEAKLFVQVRSAAPPCRQIKRGDVFDPGGARLFPPSKMQQTSQRHVGAY